MERGISANQMGLISGGSRGSWGGTGRVGSGWGLDGGGGSSVLCCSAVCLDTVMRRRKPPASFISHRLSYAPATRNATCKKRKTYWLCILHIQFAVFPACSFSTTAISHFCENDCGYMPIQFKHTRETNSGKQSQRHISPQQQ